jgi:hypothetical protein
LNHRIDSLDLLPTIEEVAETSQSLALLDAILMPEWEHRYFSFSAHWNTAARETMASMRDGSGSEYFLLFSEIGAAGKVLDVTISIPSADSLSAMPDVFSTFKAEPAFSLHDCSFFLWRRADDASWQHSPSQLSSFSYLVFLVHGASYYHQWAQEYYEREIPFETLSEVFATRTCSKEQAVTLNEEVDFDALQSDMSETLGS